MELIFSIIFKGGFIAMTTNAMEMEKMEMGAPAKKLSIKKIITIFVVLLLAANICATVMQNRTVGANAEMEQMKANIATLQQDIAAVKASVEELKKSTDSIARVEYEGFKAELGILSSLVEEMGKNIPE